MPRRVWGGTGLLVLGRLWGSLCTLTYLYLLARHLSPSGFGRLTFYLALFLLLDSLVDLGTAQAAVQRTANDPGSVPGVLRVARRVRIASGSLGVLLVGGGAFLAREPGAGWILLASFYPLSHVFELSTLVFKNRIAWSRPVGVRALASATSLALVGVFLVLGVDSAALYLVAVALGSTLGNVLLHTVARRHLPQGDGTRIAWRPFLAAALPIGLAGLCQQTYFYVDNLFVRAWVGEAALGHYNVAVRFMSYGIMVAVYAALAALPWLTREHEAGRLGPAVTRLAQPMLALASFAVGLAWPFGEELLGLFGEGFRAAADSLRWLFLACLAVYVGAPLLTAVVATGRASQVLITSAMGLFVNLLGNTWLVPRMGMTGAAAATLATELSVVAGAAFFLSRSGWRPGTRALLWLGAPAAFALGRSISGWVAAA